MAKVLPIFSYLLAHLQGKNEEVPQITTDSIQQLLAYQVAFYAALMILIESGYLRKMTKPISAPLTRAIKLLHHSLQTTKKWQAYDIREISSMLDFELLKQAELTQIEDQDPQKEHQRVKDKPN